MCAVDEYRIIDAIHDISHLGCRTRGHLLYLLHGVKLVARIDALGAVACEKVLVILQSAHTLHYGQTLFLGNTGINGRLIHDDIALIDNLTHCLAGTPKRLEVRMVVIVNGCWYGYNVEVAVAYIVEVGATDKVMVMYSVAKQFIRHFQCGIMTLHKLVYTMLVHIETNSRILC